MLQFFRTLAKSFAARVLFVLLIFAFGFWGIGDLLRQTLTASWVVKVGDSRFSPEEVHAAIENDLQRLRDASHRQIDRDEAKQMGLVQHAVTGLVDRSLLDQEARRMHIVAGDEEVARDISSDPNFTSGGRFDRDQFVAILARAGLSEPRYEQMVREELTRGTLVGPMRAVQAPDTLTDLLFRLRDEKRVADYVFLPLSTIPVPPAPAATTLQDFYRADKERYTAPETRDFTLIVLDPSDVMAGITVSDDKLRDLYQQRQGDFAHGEERHVQQMVVEDAQTAARAQQALAAGQDFARVAETIGKAAADTVDLGWITKKDLPADLAQPVFAIKPGETTPTIHSTLGWVIMRVIAIKPPGVAPFEAVKAQLIADERHDEANDALYSLSTKIEDALSAGADLNAIAQQFKLKPIVFQGIDHDGNDSQGKHPTALDAGLSTVVGTVFGTSEGQSSTLQETRDGRYYVVHVDKVTPQSLRPYPDVATRVLADWSLAQRRQTLDREAAAIAAEVTNHGTLATVAAKHRLTVQTSAPLPHGGNAATPLPPDLVDRLFVAKPGEVVTATGAAGTGDGAYIAVLDKIVAPDPHIDASQRDALRRELAQNLQGEMIEEYGQALRVRFPVKIDQTTLDSLF